MKTSSRLLVLDASPRSARSHSHQLATDYIQAWKAAHADGTVITRDLGHEPPPFVSEAWVEGAFTPPAEHSTDASAAIATSNAYVDELISVDDMLIAMPLYNLSVPAALKAWIDQIVRVGRTFAISPEGYAGLVKGKRAHVIVASGGDFRPGSQMGGYNFAEPYLRAILGFIGITDVSFVYAHSLNSAEQRTISLSTAQAEARALATAA